jgi:uncharacterized membrane protein
MAVIEQVTCIEAPVEKVFAYIGRPENNKEWIPDVVESEKLTEGPNRPGSRFRFVTRAPLGLRVSAEAEITAMDPPRMLEFRSVSGVEHRGRWELEARDGVTRVRFRLEYRLTGIETVVLRAAGMRHFLSRHVQGSIEGLRHALENGTPTD